VCARSDDDEITVLSGRGSEDQRGCSVRHAGENLLVIPDGADTDIGDPWL
jgi:hypothetical protein